MLHVTLAIIDFIMQILWGALWAAMLGIVGVLAVVGALVAGVIWLRRR